ncbi:putative mitochondrial hypothetical protein [Leptomonas pyrrhocoris]|uniref:MSP domain-containing protein n=1 Tax=Leptomonas pyrrhocoris TaxID=157538 RepID=A0A0N0DTL0_LEPPY|nr:putative mitochondrial hypothetical protein [Leptomonas pyrrhocoris]KPA77642.1 putative mitochondrial hypothetical protein [Leptomonas pyrrhocoris]|eukprot:XP_015656081.1 putative mitochondrial hypothetical protein [Leptomonas pyrrhocoris]
MDSAVPNVIVNPEKFELALHANEDCTFELTNVGYEAVIYRVRTTAPQRYYLKHSKGVVKGNSSAKVTIFLNRKHFAEGVQPGQRFTKDTFRVECAVLGEQDVVEAHGANLANLIQKKKDANAAAVVQKYIYCRVLLEAEGGQENAADSAGEAGRTSTTNTTNAAAAAGVAAEGGPAGDNAGAEGGSRKGMTAKQMEQNTLKEKRRRNDGGQSVVRGGHTGMIRMGIVAVLVLVFAWWMVRGGGEVLEESAE